MEVSDRGNTSHERQAYSTANHSPQPHIDGAAQREQHTTDRPKASLSDAWGPQACSVYGVALHNRDQRYGGLLIRLLGAFCWG
jgi:hypothetical protein